MDIVTPLPEQGKTATTLSVIVPYFNEESVLPCLHKRLTKVLDSLTDTSEIIYVDDGSADNSLSIVTTFDSITSKVTSLSLSRNFGKEAAMSAGLAQSNGAAVIIIDADLQDPPELIPEMLAKWREGYDVVNMQRSQRLGETWFKKKSAAIYYRLLNAMSKTHIPENVGDFRLLSRKIVDHINLLPERNRYMKGIFSWPGFKQNTLTFERDARYSGETKWNYLKLIGLAVEGITSFTISPLRIATMLGFFVTLGTFLYGLAILVKTLIYGDPTAGYPSMMLVQLALGGIQLLSIGVLGEYVGRIFIETKQRPLYLIQSVHEKQAKLTPKNEEKV